MKEMFFQKSIEHGERTTRTQTIEGRQPTPASREHYAYQGYEGAGLDQPANRKWEAPREQGKNRGQRVA